MKLYDQDNTEENKVIEVVSCEETDIWQEAEEIEMAKSKNQDWIVAVIALVAAICVVVVFTLAQINQTKGFAEPQQEGKFSDAGFEHEIVESAIGDEVSCCGLQIELQSDRMIS